MGSIETVKFDLDKISFGKSNTKDTFFIGTKNSKSQLVLRCTNSRQLDSWISQIELAIKENFLP
jgi:hypothetical protein